MAAPRLRLDWLELLLVALIRDAAVTAKLVEVLALAAASCIPPLAAKFSALVLVDAELRVSPAGAVRLAAAALVPAAGASVTNVSVDSAPLVLLVPEAG